MIHVMSEISEQDPRIEILKALGHRSRTLLNGITGPVEIIRSLSDEPKLIEPLRILELSISQFDKFSFRALLLSDLIKNSTRNLSKTLDLVEVTRYIILDLTDLLDFYNIKIELNHDKLPIEVISDFDLLNHCLLILFEHIISLSNEGSSISVDITNHNNKIEYTINCLDNGFVYKSLNPIYSTSENPSDLELYLLKVGTETLKSEFRFTLSTNNQSIIRLRVI